MRLVPIAIRICPQAGTNFTIRRSGVQAIGDRLLPRAVNGRRLASLLRADIDGSADSTGITITATTFRQIALLQPEVLNRCQEGIEEATALLGLVLCHVAPNDSSWESERTIRGKRLREEVELETHGALWLADLRFRAWVPIVGEDDKITKVVANRVTLSSLLDPLWLQGNDAAIRLLSRWFGFDELELRLMGTSPEGLERQKLRDGLAKLVEVAGGIPETYLKLAAEIDQRQRRKLEIERSRSLGLAVQEAIRNILEGKNLKVELVDRGFDFQVEFPEGDPLLDASTRIGVGPYLLEVKATRSGHARLTPAQAEMAAQESERFVLCVVDLRRIPTTDIESVWTPELVEPLTTLSPAIGETVAKTRAWVEEARSSAVAICNDSALRYDVPPKVWGPGLSIESWIASISWTVK